MFLYSLSYIAECSARPASTSYSYVFITYNALEQCSRILQIAMHTNQHYINVIKPILLVYDIYSMKFVQK